MFTIKFPLCLPRAKNKCIMCPIFYGKNSAQNIFIFFKSVNFALLLLTSFMLEMTDAGRVAKLKGKLEINQQE